MRIRRSYALGGLILMLALAACQSTIAGTTALDAAEINVTETSSLAPPSESLDEAPRSPTIEEGSYQEGFTAQGDPFKGSLDAPVLMEEFSSYQCPYCGRYFRESYPRLVDDYVESGQVLYIFRDFPLAGQAQSRLAAEAAACAGELGEGSAFWTMHDWLLGRQSEWSGKAGAEGVFIGYAEEQGLDSADFGECLGSGAMRAQIDADASEGSARGVRGTPTFFINGRPLVGAQPYEVITQAIDAALAGEEVPTPEPPAAPTPAQVAAAGDVMTLGDENAPVTIVEFSDYQCPFCASHYREVWPLIKSDFVDTGRVRYVFKDFALTSIHPQAAKAHEAARCAGDQGAYWEMHDLLFDRQDEWGGASDHVAALKRYAAELGLASPTFDECLDSDRWAAAVGADIAEGGSLGVQGTPTFLIDGYPLIGVQAFETWGFSIGLAEQGRMDEAFRGQE
jgi:protein-disulfide isomerase